MIMRIVVYQYMFILFVCFVSTSHAGTWQGNFEVTNIVIEGVDNQPFVNFSLLPNPQTSCADNTFTTMPTSSEMGKQALSVLMMALAANKKVKVYIEGCLGNRPHVRHVWVMK